MQEDIGGGGQTLPSGFRTEVPDQFRPSRRAKKAEIGGMRARRQLQEQKIEKRTAWIMMQAVARKKHAASTRNKIRRMGEILKWNNSTTTDAAKAARTVEWRSGSSMTSSRADGARLQGNRCGVDVKKRVSRDGLADEKRRIDDG